MKANLVGAEEMTDDRAMPESSKRRLAIGNKARYQGCQSKADASAQNGVALEPSESELENQTLGKPLKQLDGHNQRADELDATKEAYQ